MAKDVLIPAQRLEDFVARIFENAGCAAGEARDVAVSLMGANLTGHDSHGVIRVPRYVGYLKDGLVVAGQTIEVVSDAPSFAVVDGRLGLGQTIGRQAVKLGIGKAAATGVAIVALRRSGHLGRIGEWAEMAAEAGQVSLHFVNVSGPGLVAPFGGVERRLSTAPVAIGIPQQGTDPVLLDFSTARVAEGKVLVAQNGGKKVPDDALITPEGKLSGDPAVLYGPVGPGETPNPRKGKGALRAMGEHKGSGLAIMCELLAGALTGNGASGLGTDRPFANGMLSIYMSAERFVAADAWSEEVREFVAAIRGTRPATPGGEVLMPGDPERRTRKQRLAEGVPLPEPEWEAIRESARSVGLNDSAV
jgi:hydroxycarboxylate dehydrogenase B